MLQLHFNSVWQMGWAYGKRFFAVLLVSAFTLFLTACGNGDFPNSAIIEQAIARQVEQIQAPLSRQLKLPAPTNKDIRINHIDVRDRRAAMINGSKTYHISGQYDLTLKQKDQQITQLGDTFDIYLQPKLSGKVTQWQLAQKTGDVWQLETLATK